MHAGESRETLLIEVRLRCYIDADRNSFETFPVCIRGHLLKRVLSIMIFRSLTASSRCCQLRNMSFGESYGRADLSETDPEAYALFKEEKLRQRRGLEMIASENFTSKAVLQVCNHVEPPSPPSVIFVHFEL